MIFIANLLYLKNKKGVERKMYPKYKCFGCGNIWHSGEILAICPVCRGKGVKIKDGSDVKKVAKKLKGGDPIARISFT